MNTIFRSPARRASEKKGKFDEVERPSPVQHSPVPGSPLSVPLIDSEKADNLDSILKANKKTGAKALPLNFTTDALDIAVADRQRTRKFLLRMAGCQPTADNHREEGVTEKSGAERFDWSLEPPIEFLVSRMGSVEEGTERPEDASSESLDEELLGDGGQGLSDEGSDAVFAKARGPRLPFQFSKTISLSMKRADALAQKKADMEAAQSELAAFAGLA
mmetsp:Transcript_8879/g.24092  ORF Transcript_8879/g.24092 Transcript_8879/m.24092 type:complete len:218 (-) Transcript_8879:1607-2260(-)|eukprot:CAMPEP_0113915300 /NCGR_PEP_ID=MMETSP0780_2-20120614/31102_1 /TAXON_ID=652834 /ORGANISM="Palpitomonas bilix" /LENGTH=217 /DNA_ID=CAMNT_0000913747 /DNA_START=176 /DNA_END=829 /DNA_ORIENTATION=+ /assembly_acc=CAM_ASM_000599